VCVWERRDGGEGPGRGSERPPRETAGGSLSARRRRRAMRYGEGPRPWYDAAVKRRGGGPGGGVCRRSLRRLEAERGQAAWPGTGASPGGGLRRGLRLSAEAEENQAVRRASGGAMMERKGGAGKRGEGMPLPAPPAARCSLVPPQQLACPAAALAPPPERPAAAAAAAAAGGKGGIALSRRCAAAAARATGGGGGGGEGSGSGTPSPAPPSARPRCSLVPKLSSAVFERLLRRSAQPKFPTPQGNHQERFALSRAAVFQLSGQPCSIGFWWEPLRVILKSQHFKRPCPGPGNRGEGRKGPLRMRSYHLRSSRRT
jgi:hypothetical protein